MRRTKDKNEVIKTHYMVLKLRKFFECKVINTDLC